MAGVKSCKQCGCSEIDTDPSRGDAVCTNCGYVLEESIIVSEVTFEEDGHGRSSAIGQFVSSESRGGGGIGTSGTFHSGVGKESREMTLKTAKRKITEVAQQLRLNQHCIDVAYNFFKMALHKQLTKGRKNSLTIAACVYMTCRIEGTPHLLIDFSDVVQMDVYALGRAYVQISRALYINIPTVDPCIYILRFAHKFELGDQTHDVAMTALRLVQRMKRDWIHLGRRPSGLCGAALLIAARLHKFSRSVQDIIRVVKVHETTLRKRLVEFGETPSSSLTLDEFMSVDLEEEHDPPSFKEARVRDRERLQKLLDDQVSSEFLDIQKKIEEELDKRRKKSVRSLSETPPPIVENNGDDTSLFIVESTLNTINSIIGPMDKPQCSNREGIESSSVAGNIDKFLMPPPIAEKMLFHSDTTERSELNEPMPESVKNHVGNATTDCTDSNDSGELDLNGIDDDEINGYLMNSQEVKRKTVLWEKLNSDFIAQQQQKKENMEKEKLEGKPEKRRKKKPQKPKSTFQAKSANEAIKIMLTERKMSSKINYDVLKTLTSSISENDCTNASDTAASGTSTVPTTASPLPGPEPVTVIESGPVVPVNRKRSLKEKAPPRAQGSKRVKFSENQKSENTAEVSANSRVENASQNSDVSKLENVEDSGVVVESGPVQHVADEDEDNFSEDDEERLSASTLLSQFRGTDAEPSYDDYFD